MKMRLTISDEHGGELVSQIFEIAGQRDYEQVTNNMWDQLWKKLTKKEGEDLFWNNPFGGERP